MATKTMFHPNQMDFGFETVAAIRAPRRSRLQRALNGATAAVVAVGSAVVKAVDAVAGAVVNTGVQLSLLDWTPPAPTKDKRGFLTEERELLLIERWQTQQDLRARDELVTAHLPFLRNQARKMGGYRVNEEELVQEASIGFLKAIDKFRPGGGARLATFAVWDVRSAMQAHVRANVGPVRIDSGSATIKAFGNLRRTLAEFMSGHGMDRFEALEAASAKLNIKTKDAAKLLAILSGSAADSLDATVGEDGEMTKGDLLADTRPTQDVVVSDRLAREKMGSALETAIESALDERERSIIRGLFAKAASAEESMSELGERWGVTRQRIQQIRDEAMAKIRVHLCRDQRLSREECLMAFAA